MSFLSAEKIWNGNVQQYQFWFCCDDCGEPIFEGWPHCSNSQVEEEERGYIGPSSMPPQIEIERIWGTKHYCCDCGYKLGHISKWDYIKCSGGGFDPADVDIIENEDDKLELKILSHEAPKYRKAPKGTSLNKQKRQAISKTIRFGVYKKCGFRCHYCGIPASDAQLEIDHITPVSKGGTNDTDFFVCLLDNLLYWYKLKECLDFLDKSDLETIT